MDAEKQEITAAQVGTVATVLDDNTPVKVVHKFMPGEECGIISKPDAKGGKILGVTVGEDGKTQYTVAYGVVETITEDDLTKLEE